MRPCLFVVIGQPERGIDASGCGPDNRFRVFYDVDAAAQAVQVLAIGVKDRSRLLIGGEEYES